MESNLRFMIRAYIRMAEFSDGEERQEYIRIARGLLEKISVDHVIFTKLDDCKEWVLEYLEDSEKPMYEFKISAFTYGWSEATLRRAVESLEDNNFIYRWQTGYGKDKQWFIAKK